METEVGSRREGWHPGLVMNGAYAGQENPNSRNQILRRERG